jgi:poly-gamma-glutamate capsule biosynthesis protein CapA/YwtB (metallophosphatase superfamily)
VVEKAFAITGIGKTDAKIVAEKAFAITGVGKTDAKIVAEKAFAITGVGKTDAKIASSKRQPRTSAHSAGYKEMRTTSHSTWTERFPGTAQPARR